MHAKILGVAAVALFPLVVAAQQEPVPGSVEEYASILRDTRDLQVYNAQLQRQINAQKLDIENVRGAIEKVPDFERDLPPLLIRMVDGLETFVRNDVPFRNQERADRVASLRTMLDDPKVKEAQKLRRILEAWSIEVEYGGAFATYREDSAEYLPPGLPSEVTDRKIDFIALGRVGLLFQTDDEDAITGAYDYRNRSWQILPGEYKNPVGQALRMARNQIAPELVLLPTVPPQNE